MDDVGLYLWYLLVRETICGNFDWVENAAYNDINIRSYTYKAR